MTPTKLAAWHVNEIEQWRRCWRDIGVSPPATPNGIGHHLDAALSIIRWMGRPHQRAEAIRLLAKLS